MKIRLLLFLLLLTAFSAAPRAFAQTPTPTPSVSAQPALGTGLSIDEQLKLRAAQQKAADDPAVKAALQKRNKAIDDFRTALHNAMLKADPTIGPIMSKVEISPRQT
ncbi:MAG: hypothetical protein M3R10_06730, partial [Verrucomicrobiota bacterium]|nr:hypothetical protein [Verrucomicrobiota bacterium]